jgi:DNA repair exonuclease SbcCD ATPase subunit
MFPARTLSLSVAVALAALAACSSTQGHGRAGAAADQMMQLSTSVSETSVQMAKTASSLEQVAKQAKTDPKPYYDIFAKELDRLETSLKSTSDQRAALGKAGQDWMAEWDKQIAAIQDQELRKDAADRRDELQKKFEEAKMKAEKGHADLQAIIARMKDLRSYLSADLTPDGIDRVEGKIDDVCDDAQDAAKALSKVSDDLAKVAPQFQAAKPAPAADEQPSGK